MVAMELSPGSEWFQQLDHEKTILKQQLLEQLTEDLFDEVAFSAARDIQKTIALKEAHSR